MRQCIRSLFKEEFFYFLAGLYSDFDHIRVQIPSKETLTSLRELR